MITFYRAEGEVRLPPGAMPTNLPEGTLWIDMIDESEDDLALVERLTGLRLPRSKRRAEVETSSRLSLDGDVLVMSTPVLYRDGDRVLTTPVGFVLARTVLVTLREQDLRSFGDFIQHRVGPDCRHPRDALGVLLGLLDAIVDRMADGMEAVGGDLQAVSQSVFGARPANGPKVKPRVVEAALTRTLAVVGASGDTTSQVRDSLLGLRRLVAFLAGNVREDLSADGTRELDGLRQDIDSLGEYETHLTDKVQFLLDSTLGFITIEQNRTFKLLTVASVIGIPPTFVVGLYGMNFKGMPEYDWAYGYQYGLALVLVSIVVPVVWLRMRGWF